MTEIASFAFLTAICKPRTWEVILLEMLKPAASSDAELIRLPVERRSMAVDIWRLFWVSASRATRDLTFVLITDMVFLLKELTFKKAAAVGALNC